MRRLVMAAAVAVSAASLAACGSTAATPRAASASAFSVHDATLRACKALATWERSNTKGTFTTSASGAAVQSAAENTPLGALMTAWVDDLESGAAWTQTTRDASAVFAACGVAGVPILRNG